MTYIGEHMLLQWLATFREGNANSKGFEQAVGGLRFWGGPVEDAEGQEMCDALADQLKTFWKTSGLSIPTNCYLEVVKWNAIGTDGKYLRSGETTLSSFTGVPGITTAKYPTQIAWATTWDTDKSRGRAHAGRTYWPTAVTVDPLVTTVNQSDAQTMANTSLRLIGALNSTVRANGPAAMQASVMSNIGSGAANPITGARVGIRLDVQRRRGAKVSEAYKTGVVTS